MSPKNPRRSQAGVEENVINDSEPSSSSVIKISENKTELQLPLKILNDRITCILCNGYFVDATTILDCLHTFCKSCLLKHFDEQDNTCPKCQTLIHQSHPTHYVAFDRTLQDIVYKLIPGMQEEEMRRRAEFELNNPTSSDSDDEENTDAEVEKTPNPQSKSKNNGVDEVMEDDNSVDCCLKDPCTGHKREDEPLLVVLEPHEKLPPLEKSFIRIPGNNIIFILIVTDMFTNDYFRNSNC